MWRYTILLLTVLTVRRIQAYNMEPITHSSLNPNHGHNEEASSSMSPPTIEDVLWEFESHRSPNLQVISGRLRLEDVVDLCEAVDKDDSTVIEMGEKKLYYYIPVMARSGDLPTFTPPCFGWKRKQCLGVPKPPFDYRCSFWSPYYHPGDDSCTTGETPEPLKGVDTVSLNGFEAISLCATAALFDDDDVEDDGTLKVKSVALPTNEASDLRCINWIASPEGGWIKERLDKDACELMNKKRPSPYIDNEINSGEGIIESIYEDVIKCQSAANKVECIFQGKYGVLF